MEVKYINAIVYMVSRRALLRGRSGIVACQYVPSIPGDRYHTPCQRRNNAATAFDMRLSGEWGRLAESYQIVSYTYMDNRHAQCLFSLSHSHM